MSITRLVGTVVAVTFLVFAAVAAIRSAKRSHNRAGAIAAVMFALSAIAIGKPPSEHYIEQLKETKNKTGGQSGDPSAR